MKRIIIPAIIVLTLCFAFASFNRSPDVLMDPDPTMVLQNEVSLTAVPGAVPGMPQILLAAYNDNPYAGGPGLGVSTSLDGGATWFANQLPYPFNPMTMMPMTEAFDPTTGADTQGNIYAAHISTDSMMFSGLYVHKSNNNGVTWLPPVTVALDVPPVGSPDPNFRFNDRCQMTVDRSPSSPYGNNIYITWIKDRGYNMPTPDSDIYFSFSTDLGMTFSPAMRINDIGVMRDMGNMPVPAVASDGTIYVAWIDYNVWTGGTGRLFLDVSTDGGATFGPDTFVTNINLPPLTLSSATVGGVDAIAKGAAVIDVSPNNPQDLYITYAADQDGPAPDEADILFIKSINGGVTWSAPIQVNDDVGFCDQILPWMDVKQDGTIDIAWYDRRTSPDLLWEVWAARSIDGGLSFSFNIPISDAPFATPVNPWGTKWMGEYLGVAVDQSYIFTGFTSSITHSQGDVYFDKTDNNMMPVAPLYVDTHKISVSGAPGPPNANFILNAGVACANKKYMMMGSVSGTTPGILLPSGLYLPVNWDPFTNTVLAFMNSPIMPNFLGVLDSQGKSTAQLLVGGAIPPSAAGLIMYFAYVVKPFNFVSNPVGIEIVP